MFKRLIIIGGICFCMITVFAQSDGADTAKPVIDIPAPSESDHITLNYETENDTLLSFNPLPISADSIRSLKALRPFAYAKYLDSLLNEEQNKRKPQRAQPSGPSGVDNLLTSPVTRIILWMLAGCFILFILYRLFLAQGIFSRGVKKKEEAEPEVSEDIITSESDFDQLIRQALRAGNFRLAIRYQYLKTLHKLAAKEYLALAPDKTNYQ